MAHVLLVSVLYECEVDVRLQEAGVAVKFQQRTNAFLSMAQGAVRRSLQQLQRQVSCLTVQIHLKRDDKAALGKWTKTPQTLALYT